MARNRIITGLDIGTGYVKALTCLKRSDSLDLEVLAQIKEPSVGVRKGIISNPQEVSKKVTLVLNKAQEVCGHKIDSCYVNIGGNHIYTASSRGVVAVSRADQKISEEDVDRVIHAAQAFSLPSNREIMSVWPTQFIVDNQAGIKEVIGMKGIRLETEILALCVASPYIKNLTSSVADCGVQINDVVPSSLASARAVLDQKQKELGVALIDIGAGTTSLAVFEEGDLIDVAVFPIGSANITSDIAIGLRIDIETAEKIKKELGSCIYFANKKEKVEIPFSNLGFPLEESNQKESVLVVSRKMLVRIIEARVGEIFGEVAKELKRIGKAGLLPAGAVLTGGGTKLPKIAEFAKKELRLPVKIGNFAYCSDFETQDFEGRRFIGFDDDISFSTACGLCLRGAEEGGDEGFSGVGKNVGGAFKKIFGIFVP